MALTLYDVERMQEALKEEILEEVQSMIAKETEYVEKLIPEEPWAINEWKEPKKTGLKFITEPKPKEAPRDEPWNNPNLQFVNNKCARGEIVLLPYKRMAPTRTGESQYKIGTY